MRNIISINQNWYFSKEATAVPETLCTDWEAVNVPDCWNAVDGQDGGADYHRGTCFYVKEIAKKEADSGSIFYLVLTIGCGLFGAIMVLSAIGKFKILAGSEN